LERDLENEIFEQDLLEYATATTIPSGSLAILSPAGYGLTTLLIVLGTRLARNNVGPVFMLKPGATLIEGAVISPPPCLMSGPPSLLIMRLITAIERGLFCNRFASTPPPRY
jgi:hypothetical protein